MAHTRRIVLGVASLTMARVNRSTITVAGEIMDELEPIMISSGFLDGAPFKWLGLMLRFGLVNENAPHFLGVDESDGEIAMAIELDVHDLVDASREELKEVFMIATLKTLVDVGKKYSLPYKEFEEMLSERIAARAGRAR